MIRTKVWVTKDDIMYQVRRIKSADLDPDLIKWILYASAQLNYKYGNRYDWSSFPFHDIMDNHYFAVCTLNGKYVGMTMGRLAANIFDPKCKMLRQITMFADRGAKTAYYLMNDFIDFGKKNANHVISTINVETNIKGSTLEKLGFKHTESIYRMEVK